jgi:tetratricopeptide (TPR) repeat protein
MTLAKAIAIALDRIKQELSGLEEFSRLKVNGPELRRFFHASEQLQREICFYRDKWWSKDGGMIHGELFCLVPDVQLALAGCSQSLADPDYSKPFEHFQYSLSHADVERSWGIRSVEDVRAFEQQITSWLNDIALPWFGQFESQQGVSGYLSRLQQWLKLARLHNAQGQHSEAFKHLAAWFETLPRNIETQLEQLHHEGLISDSDCKSLNRASLQEAPRYRQAVEVWRKSAGI